MTLAMHSASAELEEQLLELLDLGVFVGVRQGGGHELEADTIKRTLGRSELGDDVATFGFFVDEALKATDLALQTPQASDDIGRRVVRKLHLHRIPQGV